MKLTDLTPGMRLIADGGFTCLNEGEVVTVEKDDEGQLFVRCSRPHPANSPMRDQPHYLDDNELSGFHTFFEKGDRIMKRKTDRKDRFSGWRVGTFKGYSQDKHFGYAQFDDSQAIVNPQQAVRMQDIYPFREDQ
jgi:hypothetical protein